MILDRDKLNEVLNVIGTAVGNKVMRVADYVCFRVDKENQSLVLSSTDFHAYLSIDCGSFTQFFDDVPEKFLIEYRTLNSLVKNSTTDIVQIVGVDDSHIQVNTNGEYIFSKYLAIEDFPSADFVQESFVTWPVPLIQSTWNKAEVAVSRDVTKINYQGVYFDGNFVSTDNRRLSVIEGDEYDGTPMLIPPIFGVILKHCRNEIRVGINSSSNLIVIACDEVGLLAGVRLIDAQFVNYNHIMKLMSPAINITVDKQSVLGAIARLKTFTDKLFKVVQVRVIDDGGYKLVMNIENKDTGQEIIEIKEYDEVSAPYIVDSKYHLENMYDGLAVTESSEDVEMKFQDDGKLWVTEDRFTYLLANVQ